MICTYISMASDKGSLKLLAAYESDNDEAEEVPGSNVSVKRSFRGDSTDTESSSKHLKTANEMRLPPPSGILSMFPSQDDAPTDCPEEHGGKTRVFPHQRGNWVTFICVPVELTSWLLSWVDTEFSSCQDIKFHPIGDTHISLTRTVVLRHHWIESFVLSVRDALKIHRRLSVSLGQLRTYCNEDYSRTFIGLEVTNGSDQLHRISKTLDLCLSEFKLPPFYEEKSFHVSLAWCVGDQREALQEHLERWQCSLRFLLHSHPEEFVIPVTELICESGNKKFRFQLS